MRSGLLAGVIAWLAACEPSGGLQFEIDATGDPKAAKVAFYIGKGDGQDASIAAANRFPGPSNEGRFWPLGLAPETFELSAGDRTVTLSFEPGGDSSKVTVVAVGLSKSATGAYEASSVATKTIAHVRSDVIEVWTLKLEAVGRDDDTWTGRAVQRWGERPEEYTCVRAVDRSDVDSKLQNIFIGERGDRDCDGHPKFLKEDELNPAECDDDWHAASVKPSPKTLSCLEEVAPAGGDRVCMVGARECTDGAPSTRSDCSHSLPYCASQALCDACTEGTAEERFACVLALDVTPLPAVPVVECVFEINVGVSPAQVCPTTLILQPLAGIPLSGCVGPPVYHSPDPAAAWTSTPELGGVVFTMTAASNQCTTFITPSLVPGRTVDPNQFPAHGILAANLGAKPGIVAPVTLISQKVQACGGAERYCRPRLTMNDPNETLARCLQLSAVNP